MNRATLAALAALGPAVVSACDESPEPHDILAALTSQPQVSQSLDMPVHAAGTVSASGCDDLVGPTVTLRGELTSDSLGVRLIFGRNQHGARDGVVEAHGDGTVMPAGASVAIPRDLTPGGVGKDPNVWLQLVDDTSRPLTQEIYLGRCVEGLRSFTADFTLPATATATLVSCDINAGPSATLRGDVAFETGVAATLILRAELGARDTATASAGLATLGVLPAWGTTQFTKPPGPGGAANPWLTLQFLSATGAAIGQEHLLGRCV